MEFQYPQYNNNTYYNKYKEMLCEFVFKSNTNSFNKYGKIVAGYVTIPESNPNHFFTKKIGDAIVSTPIPTKLGLLVKGQAISIYKLEGKVEMLQKFGFDLRDVESHRAL